MSQREDILDHLRNRGPLTGAEAYHLFGCMRLPARVSDLRDEGWPIKSRFIAVTTRDGRRTHCAQYYIEKEAHK